MRKDFIDGNEIIVTEEFEDCLASMQSGKNCFITGDAGTGKSTLLKLFLKETEKNVVVLAPTGVAAVNVGGQTIHSFFGFPPKPISKYNVPMIKSEEAYTLFKAIDIIVIDEISMVRADLFDAIDYFFERNFPEINKKFGGKQLILFGDLNQLPPVAAHAAEREMIQDNYRSRYFFDAYSYYGGDFQKFHLTKIFRQSDEVFIALLNRFKSRKATIADFDVINSFHRKYDYNDPDAVILCALNRDVDSINQSKLDQIKGHEYNLVGVKTGKFDMRSCNADEVIRVKIGAKVMILINGDDYCNGTIGELTDVQDNFVVVEIDGIPTRLEKNEYKAYKYNYDKEKKSINSEQTGTFTQYPIKLAWAVSIHKAQGKTLKKVIIDNGESMFESGQLYVALSRVRSINDISINNLIMPRDLIYDDRVLEFINDPQI